MKNTTILNVLLILVNLSSYAQNTIDDPILVNKLFKSYDSSFSKDREWIYTHFNKSTYIAGDDIWFTSYVLNPVSKKLNDSTSKLYVELWSPDRQLISRKILLVEAGTANHYIHLADSLMPGTYCFRAYTNWMRNFYEEKDFNTAITILRTDKPQGIGVNLSAQREKNPEPTNKLNYDIQFLPESGHFLEGVNNIFGVKATDQYGRGIRVTGKVLNDQNQELMSFSTNSLGLGNIAIAEASNQQYIAKVCLPDETICELQLPKTEPKGLIMHINPYLKDVVWLNIQTNEATRQLNKSYHVLIHANGIVFSHYHIRFSKESMVQFKINKKEIPTGILYATLFDENLTPIAERLFYNQDTLKRGKLTINTEVLPNDSINLKIAIRDSLNNPEIAKLSVSILPGETVFNHFSNSLLSESILRPVLRGTIENPNWYFETNNAEHTIAIDNLLLTQGWRKYDWPEILKDTVHKFAYPFENAFTIKGSVKNWIKNKTEQKSIVTILSPQNNIMLLTPVDSTGAFKIEKAYLADSTWVTAVATSDKRKDWNRVIQMSIPEAILGAPEFKQIIIPSDSKSEIADNIPNLTKGVVRLKEVVIKATKRKPFEGNIYAVNGCKIFEITKENHNQFSSVELLLQTEFNVRTERSEGDTYHFDLGRGLRDPIMLIDGVRVSNPKEILNFPIELIEAVAVNKSGAGAGIGGMKGVLIIKTRTRLLQYDSPESTNKTHLMVKGYAVPTQYFEPKYLIQPGTIEYDKYATIFWKPELVTDSKSRASFRFSVPKEIKSVTIRAEGISVEGITFLHEQKIVLQDRN